MPYYRPDDHCRRDADGLRRAGFIARKIVFWSSIALIALSTSRAFAIERQTEPVLPVPPPPPELTKNDGPVTFNAGVDNQGYPAYGLNQWTAGATWSNIGSAGQSLSYQFARSFSELYASHALTYTVPLPWKDQLVLSAAFTDELNAVGVASFQRGNSLVVSPRYTHFLPQLEIASGFKLTHNVQIGYDFKTANDNALLIDGDRFGRAEVHQFPLIYNATLTDPWGETVLMNLLTFSPGELNALNSTREFQKYWAGSSARYVYDGLSITRTTKLPKEFSWVVRAQAQIASSNLPVSETPCLGGMKAVRGYAANGYCDDEGFLVDNEVWSPAFNLGGIPWSAALKDSEQIGLFVDYGHIQPHTGTPDQRLALASAGAALRATAGPYVDLALDTGVRLIAPSFTPSGSTIAPELRKRGLFVDFSLTLRY